MPLTSTPQAIEICRIKIGHRKQSGLFAIVEVQDFDHLSKFNWSINNGYAYRAVFVDGKQKNILMHREIIQPKNGNQVDHINGIRLDNRRSNLRECTPAENCRNMHHKRNRGSKNAAIRSKFRGVFYRSDTNQKWYSEIIVNYKKHRLGRFSSELEAAMAYDKAAKKFFGEFANPNLIP